MSEERLQKVLARAGVASRRKVEEMIRQGLVTVNGQVATLGDRADLEKDAVKVDGKRIHPMTAPHLYLLLHKPSGVMSTVSDPEGRETLLDLVPPALHKGLVPVGRLDFMTTGLILLTTDGEFAHRVAHPRYGCTKTYEVKVKGQPDAIALRRLREGIAIEGRKTAPAEVEHRPLPKAVASDENTWWTVSLTEGRTRQIREMFLRVGHPVLKLRRVAIGTVRDDHLPQGKLRELTEKEVESLRKGVRERPAKQRGSGGKRGRPPKPKDDRERGGKKTGKAPGQRSGGGKPGGAKPRGGRPSGSKPGGKGPGGRGPSGKGPARKGPARRGTGSQGPGGKGSGGKGSGGKGSGGRRPGGKGRR
ncbi:MAG: pseudouridine synthase [Acidobacteriota bacterium]|nr:pseudouridine synthase [Acidobacteriota bacterium]